jgi:hypothetical protein
MSIERDLDGDESLPAGEEFARCPWCFVAAHYGHAIYCPAQSVASTVASAEHYGTPWDARLDVPLVPDQPPFDSLRAGREEIEPLALERDE